MSVLRNLYSRSEQWRLEWGCRTCISVAVVSFLYLYGPTKVHLTRYGLVSTSFATVITVFVKDLTLGQTLTNAWSSILGAFIAAFISWILFLIYRSFYADYVPLALLLASEFTLVLILQYMEMPPVVKKIGVSMVAIHLIANRNHPNPSFYIWGLFVSVCIGCACAMVGCIIPLPVRLAGKELQDRAHYYSDTLSSLVEDLTISWMNTYKRTSTAKAISQANQTRETSLSLGSSPDRTLSRKVGSERAELKSEKVLEFSMKLRSPSRAELVNRHWRLLRNVLLAIAVFKRTRALHTYATFHPNATAGKKDFNTRYIRQELVIYLQECLPFLLSRNVEAKFGPSRRIAVRCEKYVKLIQDMLLIVGRLETHVENMEKLDKYHYMYAAFFARPNLQYGLVLYAKCLAETIRSISRVLQVQSSLHDDLLHPSPESYTAVDAAARLLKARDYFDAEYLKARKDIFYPERAESPPVSPTAGRGAQSPATRRAEATPGGGGSPGRRAPTKDTLPKQNGQLSLIGLRAYGKAMIDVNSVVFLLDTLSRLLLEFWSLDELTALGMNDAPASGTGDSNAPAYPAYSEKQSDTAGVVMDSEMLSDKPASEKRSKISKFWNGLLTFVWELFPTKQSHLLCFTLGEKFQIELTVTKAIRQRMVSALTVAVAMTLAALYGIINRRPQASLASLTIAFLSGGAVSGMNVMTCINRSAGTAVACVYAVMVAYIISDWHSELAKNLFVGTAVVLIQIPACYVRSYPLYSYSGTVTGFTVAMLLLTSNATTAFAVNRIIDTYVGVTIYMVLEFLAAATFTEDEIISDMRHVFEGIEEKYTNFHRNFHFFKAAEDSCEQARSRIRGGTLTPLEVTVELQRVEELRQDMRVRKDLEVESMQAVIRRQQLLAPFYRSEPAVFRPAVFPVQLLQDSITLQQQAVNSIQVMIWAVKACDGTFNDKLERVIAQVHERIKPELPTFDAELHALEGFEMQRLYRSEDLEVELELRSGISDSETVVLVADRPTSHRGSSTTLAAGKAISILPEFKTLLLPLEPHFIEVQNFVSAVLVFLSAAMDRVRDWKSTLKAFHKPARDMPMLELVIETAQRCGAALSTAMYRTGLCGKSTEKHLDKEKECRAAARAVRRATGVLAQLSAVAQSRHVAQLGHITADFPHQVYERLTYGKDDVFDTDQVDQLYLNYQNLIEGLQKGLTADVLDHDSRERAGSIDGTEGAEDRPAQRRIPSNREIIIVNTFLASTQQLISALHGLTVMTISTIKMARARQADYDQLMKEMISEGASVEEANCEAQEVFGGSGYDMSAVYAYNSVQEMKEKEQVDIKFKTLEDKAALANYVNSYVSMKSLEKSLNTPTVVSAGILKLAESRKLLQSVLRILAQTVGVEEEEEDDEDDEDPEENRISQKVTLLEFAALIVQKGQSAFLDFPAAILLTEEVVKMLCKLLDEVSDEPRIVEKLQDLLGLLCAHEENRRLLSDAGLVALLELAVKMNKKSASIGQKAAALITMM